MDKQMQVFENQEFGQIRIVMRENEPWFVAADVCKVLEHSNPTMAVKGLDADEKMTLNFAEAKSDDGMTLNFSDPRLSGNRGGAQSIVIINEPGLYQLVIRSNKPQAKEFKRWVTHDVLPTIRKTGGYVNNEELFIEDYLPFASDGVKAMFRATLATVREQNEMIARQRAEIRHKEDVIVGLVDDIDLATKRQRITQIIRYRSKNYRDRYNLLYSEFEKKYHLNLEARMNSDEALMVKPKIKNKMDYIDRVMDKIPELYEIACKVFENDVAALMEEWREVITRDEAC